MFRIRHWKSHDVDHLLVIPFTTIHCQEQTHCHEIPNMIVLFLEVYHQLTTKPTKGLTTSLFVEGVKEERPNVGAYRMQMYMDWSGRKLCP